MSSAFVAVVFLLLPLGATPDNIVFLSAAVKLQNEMFFATGARLGLGTFMPRGVP